MKSGDNATLSYASFYLQQMANGNKVKENLNIVYNLCRMRDYEELVYDFFLLYWAWDDLDYDDTHPNHYWDEVSRNNIEQTVIEQSRKWIEKNKIQYELKII